MEIKFDDLTDQQCVDIIAHFIKRKNVSQTIKEFFFGLIYKGR